jgi:hypothetical protein
MDTTIQALPDIKEALNEYFKLKFNYETQNMINKKKIMNNSTLSNKEKRSEYLKLKPKCINCKRPGGTKFNTIFLPDTDTGEGYRQHSAICGIISDPCNLNIKIQIGKVELLPIVLNSIQKLITDEKNIIIDDKNKLLFGYLTTEEALTRFENNSIGDITSTYELYLEEYNSIVDNDSKKQEINESITNSYIQIYQIKECIKKMNDTDNVQFAHDAVSIYNTTLIPLLNKIRELKYNENMVWHNDDSNTCNLIQNRYSIKNLSYSSFDDKIVSYNVGLEFKLKKPKFTIESDSQESGESSPNLIKLPSNPNPRPTGEIPEDEPIFGKGKDGISWNIDEYNKLWDRLSIKFRNALKLNTKWMTNFMYNCVNARAKGKVCVFTAPDELIIPPNKLQNGQYDFGVQIYNDEFSNLPESLQKTYLSMHLPAKDGTKNLNYNMMRNAMNDLVEKAVNFNRGYL